MKVELRLSVEAKINTDNNKNLQNNTLLWAKLNRLPHQLPYFSSYIFRAVFLFFCSSFELLWKQVVIGGGNALARTSALADNTAMIVLLEAHRTDFTTRQVWAFLTPTDFTAMLVLPRWPKLFVKGQHITLSIYMSWSSKQKHPLKKWLIK